MKPSLRSVLPALLLAAGCLAATVVSLSATWAVAGPALLAATAVAAGALRRHLLGRRQAFAVDAILGGAIVAAGAMVAAVEPASVPMMMPILSACAVMTLMPKRRCAAA